MNSVPAKDASGRGRDRGWLTRMVALSANRISAGILRGALALAAIGFLIAMVITGALPQQRQRVQFEAKGVMQVAPERVVRVELDRGAERIVFLREPGSAWTREDAGALAPPLAERLSLAVQFMHTANPMRVLGPEEFRGTDPREFGLERPTLSVALYAESGLAVRARFGGPNPNNTLRYMAVDGRAELFLMSRFVGQEWLAVAETAFAR